METTQVRPLMTNFKVTVRADVLFRHGLTVSAVSPSVYKCSWPLIVSGLGRAEGVQPLDQLPASKIKQTFLSINLAPLVAFEF